jgi:ribosomal protein L32
MIVCPVCANSQREGEVCDVCGKVLSDLPLPEAPVVPMPELERTPFAGSGVEVAVAPMPEFAPHRLAVADVPPAPFPEVERTAYGEAGPVGAAALPDLERTRLVDQTERTPRPQAQTCRYCGNVQVRGVLCDACGRAMPAVRRAEEEPEEAGEVLVIACPSCGVKGAMGRRCLSCGAFLRVPEL